MIRRMRADLWGQDGSVENLRIVWPASEIFVVTTLHECYEQVTEGSLADGHLYLRTVTLVDTKDRPFSDTTGWEIFKGALIELGLCCDKTFPDIALLHAVISRLVDAPWAQ